MSEMDVHSVLVTRIEYADGKGSKVRPALVLRFDNEVIKTFRITSQYDDKSDFIKSKYLEVIDWYDAGLKRPSWIDTVRIYDVENRGFNIKVIGKLSERDIERLKAFLKESLS